MRVHETHHRSVLKSVSYIGAVVLADLAIILFITKRAETAIQVIIATNIISLTIYYLHARAWNRIKWGIKHKHPKLRQPRRA